MFISFINSLVANPDVSFFTIPESKTVAFTKRVRALMTKANKLGVPGVTLTKLNSDPEPCIRRVLRKVYDPRCGFEVEQYMDTVVNMNMFMIQGLVPRINGEYVFVAKCEHTDTGVLVTSAPSMESEIPTAYRTAAPVCDHCKKARTRKETFVVKNAATGEIFSVGKTCLLDFFGKAGMAQILWSAQNIESRENLDSYADYDDAAGADAVATDTYLAAVLYALQQNHGVFASAAMQEKSTASQAQGMLAAARKDRAVAADLGAFYEDAVALRKSGLDHFLALDASKMSGYEHNMYTCLKSDVMAANLAYGILASLPKYLGKTVAYKKAEARVSEFVGTVGNRMEFTLTVTAAHEYETQYGVMYIYLFSDTDGNVYKWKTNGGPQMPNGDYASTGDTVTVKATVKSHDVYVNKNGTETKQTVLTRVSVIGAVAA